MELTIASQTWMFLLAIPLGAALGLCYDAFRILRLAVKHPSGVVLAEDIAFFAVCALATFGYFLVMDCGEIRGYVLAGELIGAVLYFCTASVLLLAVAGKIIAAVGWAARRIYRLFFAPLVRFFGFLGAKAENLYDIFAKTAKIKAETYQNDLKKPNQLLYTLCKRFRNDKDRETVGEPKNS